MGIGELLRSEREKRGLSLSDVEETLKIRTRYVQALEAEDFEVIPGEVFRLGFLKNYAKLLNLDSDTIIASYKAAYKHVDQNVDQMGLHEAFAKTQRTKRDVEHTKDQKPQVVAIGTPGAGKSASKSLERERKVADASPRQPVASGRKRPARTRRLLRSVAALIFLLFLVVAVVCIARAAYMARVAQRPPAVPSHPQTTESVVYSQPTTLEIKLVGTGNCWAEVKVDGVLAFTGMITPGFSKVFPAQDSVLVDLGYPEGVDVYENGTLLPPLGTNSPVTKEFKKGVGE